MSNPPGARSIDPGHNPTIAPRGLVGTAGPTIAPAIAPDPGTNAPSANGRNIIWHGGRVTAQDRAALFGHEPATLWLTGLSGAGKSTIAFGLERRLLEARHACIVLDGDNIRHGLNRDLGFAPNERRENIRRIAEVAKLLNDAGMIVVSAFISPYRKDGDAAREIVGANCFVETYLSADLACCEARDPKGLYAKARRGEIPAFTGVSAAYKPPEAPELLLDTATNSVEECVASLFGSVSSRFRCNP
jgi:adenylyl-sulfate kinase